MGRDDFQQEKTWKEEGLSAVAEFFMGSVSQKVVHGIKDLSVILVS